MSNTALFSFTKRYQAWGYVKKQQSYSTLNMVSTYLKNLRFWQKFMFQTSTLHHHNFTAHPPTCFIFLISNTALRSFTKRYQAWGYLKKQQSYSTLNVVATYLKTCAFGKNFYLKPQLCSVTTLLPINLHALFFKRVILYCSRLQKGIIREATSKTAKLFDVECVAYLLCFLNTMLYFLNE